MTSLINLSAFDSFDQIRRFFADEGLGAPPARLAPAWVPAVDIAEDEKSYEFLFDVPEHAKETLKATVEDGILTVQGERKGGDSTSSTRRLLRAERRRGTFRRSFSLPEDADVTRVEATYKDGVLSVHVAKLEKAQPKAIEIKVN